MHFAGGLIILMNNIFSLSAPKLAACKDSCTGTPHKNLEFSDHAQPSSMSQEASFRALSNWEVFVKTNAVRMTSS